MVSVNTNTSAMRAKYYLESNKALSEKAMQRLSSGLKINSVSDDAAGLSVATKIKKTIDGYETAILNTSNTISAMQQAASGLGTIEDIIIRLKELAVRSANGVFENTDRQLIELEQNQLVSAIEQIATKTTFNNINLLDGTYSKPSQVGSDSLDNFNIAIPGAGSSQIGLGSSRFTSATETTPSASLAISVATNSTSPSNLEFYTNVGSQEVSYTGATTTPSSGTTNMPTVDVVFEEFVNANSGGTYAISNFSGTGTLALAQGITFDTSNGKFTLVKGLLQASDLGLYSMDVTYQSGGSSFTQNLTLDYVKVNHLRDQISNNTTYTAAGSISLDMKVGEDDLVVDLKSSDDFKYFSAFADLHHTLTYDGGTYYSASYQLNNLQLNGASVSNAFTINDGVLTGSSTNLIPGLYTFDVVTSSGSTDTHTFTQSVTVNVTDATYLDGISLNTQSDALAAFENIETALTDISSRSAGVGANINRLESNLKKNSTTVIENQKALGRILDADIARESSNLSKRKILEQASTQMLSAANRQKSILMELLKGL